MKSKMFLCALVCAVFAVTGANSGQEKQERGDPRFPAALKAKPKTAKDGDEDLRKLMEKVSGEKVSGPFLICRSRRRSISSRNA
jgi:hypothetical protein